MSKFYLLPSRPLLGERFASFLKTTFPGLDWQKASWEGLADLLGSTLSRHPDVFVVYREELPENEDPTTALTDGFGAEAGDEVVEIHPGADAGTMVVRRWRVGGTISDAA